MMLLLFIIVISVSVYSHELSLASAQCFPLQNNLDFETAVTNLTLANLQVEQAKFNKRIAILNAIYVSGQEINFIDN